MISAVKVPKQFCITAVVTALLKHKRKYNVGFSFPKYMTLNVLIIIIVSTLT